MIDKIGMRSAPSLVGGAQPSAGHAVPVGPQGSLGSGDFGNVMSAMFKDAVGNLNAGEAASFGGMQGKVPLQQVVEAVMLAEQSLHTAVVVRDKVVGAYLEISRMQI